MLIKIFQFATLLLAAFSLSLSMTHLLELPQRIKFDQELWVKVTVFEGVYKYFGSVGAFFEIGAILAAFILAFLLRGHGSVFYWALSGAIILAIALVSWLIFVNSANAELARWLTEPVPPDWTRTSNQWEYAHAVNAFIKIIAFSLFAVSVIIKSPRTIENVK